MMNLIKSKVLKLIYVFFSILTILYQYSYADMYTVDKESIVSFDPNIKSCTAGYNLLSGGLVLTGNIIAGKTTTNLILNDINERSSARRQGGGEVGNSGINQGSDYLGFKSYQPNGYVAGYSEMYINGVYNGRLWTIYFDSGDTVQYGCYLKCALPL
ncbi:hypothetical protein [Acinetobacter nosocomialis]|uniref:hypothetical protein n=1 Tax=Acinetobacter nosocomialis TaxID=106654 RepID=UPI0024B82075|nr:hypothetical protein [Acinetobacter nosocomialis]MDI9660477.1 hypothetical protein [Acinetobacter nosocomialis]